MIGGGGAAGELAEGAVEVGGIVEAGLQRHVEYGHFAVAQKGNGVLHALGHDILPQRNAVGALEKGGEVRAAHAGHLRDFIESKRLGQVLLNVAGGVLDLVHALGGGSGLLVRGEVWLLAQLGQDHQQLRLHQRQGRGAFLGEKLFKMQQRPGDAPGNGLLGQYAVLKAWVAVQKQAQVLPVKGIRRGRADKVARKVKVENQHLFLRVDAGNVVRLIAGEEEDVARLDRVALAAHVIDACSGAKQRDFELRMTVKLRRAGKRTDQALVQVHVEPAAQVAVVAKVTGMHGLFPPSIAPAALPGIFANRNIVCIFENIVMDSAGLFDL